MGKNNPFWPEGVEEGETATYLLTNDHNETMPGAPAICFKDGVYFCDDPESDHPLAPFVLMEIERRNRLYRKAEEELE